MSTQVIDIIAAIVAIISVPLYLLGIRKVFDKNFNDLKKRRAQREREQEFKKHLEKYMDGHHGDKELEEIEHEMKVPSY